MFKLIKLALYGVAGYAIYQFYLGMTEHGRQGGQYGGRIGQLRAGERKNIGDVGGARMTGGGEGMAEQSEEASGLSTPKRVGRGVIKR